ncbi:hypothetical protein [Aquimarina litoralis]|uniref:hypothetical protein n=1 Tax=Aquimarina litoralis TaxID=584605 RepID=UPI001C5999BC|nr:hypothetical protein [Aquimarina litoralis]MBW1297114.1 hypothetical protein [Aquimarina litoralis]
MKNLYYPIIALFVFLIGTFPSYGQENMYKSQLETIYLKNTKEIVYTNTFSEYNHDLIASNEIKFKKEIKKLKGKNNLLHFDSNKENVVLEKASYLKIIRKAANRSRNEETFETFLRNNLPQLSNQLSKDNNLKELYIISRKDTFNGKIDALPSVL